MHHTPGEIPSSPGASLQATPVTVCEAAAGWQQGQPDPPDPGRKSCTNSNEYIPSFKILVMANLTSDSDKTVFHGTKLLASCIMPW